MEAFTLRKLSIKSQMKFGQYSDLTVQNLIDFKKKGYLTWCYYNMSMISFLDDILDELGISENLRIQKQGTDKEYYEYFVRLVEMRIPGISKLKNTKRYTRVKKAKLYQKIKMRSFTERKGYLQSKNHGH